MVRSARTAARRGRGGEGWANREGWTNGEGWTGGWAYGGGRAEGEVGVTQW